MGRPNNNMGLSVGLSANFQSFGLLSNIYLWDGQYSRRALVILGASIYIRGGVINIQVDVPVNSK
jgi:hypothetical protein